MKIAFISDIHGNYNALERVIYKDFRECDLCIFCGDIYGYFIRERKF